MNHRAFVGAAVWGVVVSLMGFSLTNWKFAALVIGGNLWAALARENLA